MTLLDFIKWCRRIISKLELYTSESTIISKAFIVDCFELSLTMVLVDRLKVRPLTFLITYVYYLLKIGCPHHHEFLQYWKISTNVPFTILT